MNNPFFEHPILNSPYEIPSKHWELDKEGQPTQQIIDRRRDADFITPVPKARKRKTRVTQVELSFDEAADISNNDQRYKLNETINAVRIEVGKWRSIPDASRWQVTPETARLLKHWRHHEFSGVRPFFCQVEAVETAIWLAEVAPQSKAGKQFLEHLAKTNGEANPDLFRIALKLATGAGKTTVMAMLIAWQTVNAVRRPQSKSFTRGFLIVTPGITIKDRLRVLQPSDPDSYFINRELVPPDMLDDIRRCKIVISNYHAFKLRERLELAKGTRCLLQGRGEPLNTLETKGQMIQRVMPESYGEMDYIRDNQMMINSLKSAAWINIQKLPGKYVTRTWMDDIYDAFKINKEIIESQIELLDPQVIICAGTFGIIKNEYPFSKWRNNVLENVFESNGRLYIQTYHPSQRTITRERYVDGIVQSIKAWVNR